MPDAQDRQGRARAPAPERRRTTGRSGRGSPPERRPARSRLVRRRRDRAARRCCTAPSAIERAQAARASSSTLRDGPRIIFGDASRLRREVARARPACSRRTDAQGAAYVDVRAARAAGRRRASRCPMAAPAPSAPAPSARARPPRDGARGTDARQPSTHAPAAAVGPGATHRRPPPRRATAPAAPESDDRERRLAEHSTLT